MNAAPALVIAAGASSFAIDVALVQPEVAMAMRVCSCDRAGSGWSDARSDVETPMSVVATCGQCSMPRASTCRAALTSRH